MPAIQKSKSTAVTGASAVTGVSGITAYTMVFALASVAVIQASGKAMAQPPGLPPASGATVPGREAMWNTPAPTHYRILAKPTHPHSKSPIFTPEVPLPKIESQSVQPYAYGWFGARTLPNASRHFGYRSTFTQWTIK